MMRGSIGKKLVIQMMGIVTVLCTTASLNPICMAYFSAVFLERSQRAFIIPVVLVSMLCMMPFLSAAKYMMAILTTVILICMFEARKGECSKILAAWIAGISVFAVHMGGVLMTATAMPGLVIGGLEGILVAALTLIFHTGIHRLLKERESEVFTNDEMISLGILFGVLLYGFRNYVMFTQVLGPVCMYLGILLFAYRYGIGLGAALGTACGVVMTLWNGDIMSLGVMCFIGVLAGAFRSLGKLGTCLGYLAGIYLLGSLYAPFLMESGNQLGVLYGTLVFLLLPRKYSYRIEHGQKRRISDAELEERKGRILETAESIRMLSKSIGRFREENDFAFAASMQLHETAGLLEHMTASLQEEKQEKSQMQQGIERELRRHQMEMKQIYITKQKSGRDKIRMSLRTTDRRITTVKEVNQVISKGYGKRMRASFDSKTIVNGEYALFTFVEEPRFMVLSGMAGVSKTGEKISGDNFSLTELSEGQMLMGIVDGMGSGLEASEESEQIIELLEDLLRTGFEEEAALRLVNSVLLGKSQNEASTAVDIAVADLYSGTCSFIKSGAAATFIKRNQWVEMMKSTSLPVGVLKEVDYENTSKKLYDGDYIIMVSDGVLEAMEGEEKEEEFVRLLMDMNMKNPKELADAILQKACEVSNGEVSDDMTVLVTGIWEKAA